MKKYSLLIIALIPKLLKLTKVVKVILISITLGSYAYLFTWQFALVIMGTVFIHEMGHLLAMKYYGIPTKGMYFIPFLGGVAVGNSTGMVLSEKSKYVISLAGPAVTLLQMLVLVAMFYEGGCSNFTVGGLASFSALILVLNLMPILPLDGGQIFQALSRSLVSGISVTLSLALNLFFIYIATIKGVYLLTFMCMVGCLEIILQAVLRAKLENAMLESNGMWHNMWIQIKYILASPSIVAKPLSVRAVAAGVFLYTAVLVSGILVVADMGRYPQTRAALLLLEDK